MITENQLLDWFTYHPPQPGQNDRYIAIRNAALEFSQIVIANAPPGADQTAAIRKIREAVMTANAAIACEPRPVE
jgi:hypothetical protein